MIDQPRQQIQITFQWHFEILYSTNRIIHVPIFQ
jgi:hypothetical protein